MPDRAAEWPALRKLAAAAFPRNAPTFARLLAVYRFSSVILTSAFYLVQQPAAWAPYKFIVVATLALSALLVSALLNLQHGDAKFVSITIVIETLGISLLLVPSGGMDSPYLWYALNPVLVAACYLRPYFSWILLGCYSLTATLVSTVILGDGLGQVLPIIQRRGVFFLIFVMSVLAMQLLAQLIRKKMADEAALQAQKEQLDAANQKLTVLNAKLEESVDDLMALYRSVDELAAETDQNIVLACLTQYAVKLGKSDFAFFVINESAGEGGRVVCSGESPVTAGIERMAGELIDGAACSEEPAVLSIGGREFLALSVKSTTRLYGLLCIAVNAGGPDGAVQIDGGRMGFIASLCGIVLERVGANEVENRLTIAQERNRIADEIHDSICQRLFSITCSAHSLATRFDGMDHQELKEQLALIEECAKAANQEIRLCVYGLSSKKKRVNTLFEELEKYLWSYAKLNNIILDIDMKGDDSILSAGMQKSLHRIVRESCGNAARHGRCKNVGVKLAIEDRSVFLRVRDDGVGFDARWDRPMATGVGIKNITAMVEHYGGTFGLESLPNRGTTVTVRMPLYHEDESSHGEEAI